MITGLDRLFHCLYNTYIVPLPFKVSFSHPSSVLSSATGSVGRNAEAAASWEPSNRPSPCSDVITKGSDKWTTQLPLDTCSFLEATEISRTVASKLTSVEKRFLAELVVLYRLYLTVIKNVDQGTSIAYNNHHN